MLIGSTYPETIAEKELLVQTIAEIENSNERPPHVVEGEGIFRSYKDKRRSPIVK